MAQSKKTTFFKTVNSQYFFMIWDQPDKAKITFAAECDFDGGDCCSPVVYTNVCNECQCHDTSIKGNMVKVG